METHSSILAWEIQWTEGPGRLRFMRLQRFGHDLANEQQQFVCKCLCVSGSMVFRI